MHRASFNSVPNDVVPLLKGLAIIESQMQRQLDNFTSFDEIQQPFERIPDNLRPLLTAKNK